MDLIAEEGEVTMNEVYKLNFKKEILNEQVSIVMAQIFSYMQSNSLTVADKTNPFVEMFLSLNKMKNISIIDSESLDELNQIQGAIDFAKQTLKSTAKAQVEVA
jgi:elongation factor P--beta-lysine ligase